jgi:hypothetical protein
MGKVQISFEREGDEERRMVPSSRETVNSGK